MLQQDQLKDRLAKALRGRYTIDRVLGRGGMAIVYLAMDIKHQREVAIKVLRPEFSSTLTAGRFAREIKIAAKLDHPNILALFDSGRADKLDYYVMPFVDGETLRKRIHREGQLSISDTVKIATDIAAALGESHKRGIVHRDIKPENILMAGNRVLVADFGVARAITEAGGDRLSSSGLVVGTPDYMSPEQGSANGTVDARSDIYALGCVVYQMLTGEPPFTGPSTQSIIARHMHEAPRSIRVVRDAVPIHIEQAVRCALAKVPADRYQTATAFAEALAAGPLDGGGAPSRQPLTGAQSPATPERRTISEEAHRLYRQGRVFWNKRLEGGLDQAMQYFREAEEKDGLYAAALAGQADCYAAWGFYEFKPPRVTFPAALHAAERALQLDGGLAEAHAAKGVSLMYYHHDWSNAEESLQAAIRIDPTSASVHQYYAVLLAARRRFDEAIKEMRLAREYDQISAIVSTTYGWILYLSGRNEEAEVSLREDTLAKWPRFGVANGALGQVYLALGRPDDAITELKKSVEQRFPPALAALGHVYGAAGKTEEACQVLVQLQQRADQGFYISAYDRASVYAGMGDRDKTMEWLDKAYEEKSTWLILAGVHPSFRGLYGDERFEALIRKVGSR